MAVNSNLQRPFRDYRLYRWFATFMPLIVLLGFARTYYLVPLGDMFLFAIFVGGALYFRRRMDIHKRLMLLAAATLLTAAVARIPLDFILNGGPVAFFGLTDLCLVAFVLFDTLKHRKLHPVFLWGTLLFIVSQPLRLLLAGTDLWIQFATWLVGFAK